jgi:uncharacterized protein YceK
MRLCLWGAMQYRAIALALMLGGCSSLMGVGPDVDYQVVVAAVVQDCDGSPGQNTRPLTAMEVGFSKVLAACEGFFVEATRAQQNALATDRTLDLGLVAAVALINQTNPVANALKAVTITTAGVVLAKGLVDEYTKIYAFNTHLYKVRELTYKTMEDYMANARKAPPENFCMAYTYVQKLATLCSLAALKANLDSQVAAPSVIATTPTGTAPRSGAPRSFSARTGAPTVSGPPPINYSVFTVPPPR